MFLSRRQFLKATVGTVAAVADQVLALTALQPVIEVGNLGVLAWVSSKTQSPYGAGCITVLAPNVRAVWVNSLPFTVAPVARVIAV
jgi:TAT (twin-arginine translocation) pathway-exported protein